MLLKCKPKIFKASELAIFSDAKLEVITFIMSSRDFFFGHPNKNEKEEDELKIVEEN